MSVPFTTLPWLGVSTRTWLRLDRYEGHVEFQQSEMFALTAGGAEATEALLTAVRYVEWCHDGENDRCPSCGMVEGRGNFYGGHDRSCVLGAALEKVRRLEAENGQAGTSA